MWEYRRITVCPHYMDPVLTFNWDFEYQSIASEILTKESRYNRAESNLLVDKKRTLF